MMNHIYIYNNEFGIKTYTTIREILVKLLIYCFCVLENNSNDSHENDVKGIFWLYKSICHHECHQNSPQIHLTYFNYYASKVAGLIVINKIILN